MARLGDVVHYWPQGGTEKRGGCQAAIVTAMRRSGLALTVFSPGLMPLPLDHVPHDEDQAPGTWHWPEPAEPGT